MGVAALVVVAVLVAGCGGDSGGSDESEPIKVGTSLPLTGANSELGVAVQRGYKTWASVVNDAGGLLERDVEMKVLDDADNQNTVISDYEALISKDEVDLILGTFSTRLTLPAMSVARKNQMLYLNPAGGAREVFEQGYELMFYTEPAPPWKFGVPFADYLGSLPESERPKTVAYVVTEDPFASTSVEGMKPVIEKAGIETVYDKPYPLDTRNFDPIATQVKNAGADVVVGVGQNFEEEVGLARALIKAGAEPDFFYQINAPVLTEEYLKAIGSENTEGVFFTTGYTPQLKSEGNREFVRKFEAAYGESPDAFAAFGFATGQVLDAAVEAVGADGFENQRLLADWLADNSVETVVGELKWDDRGVPQSQFVLSQWQGGEPKVISPPDLAETDNVLKCWIDC